MRSLRDRVRRCSRAVALVLIPLCFSLSSCAHGPTVGQRQAGVAVWDLDDLSPGPPGEHLGELFAAQVMEVLKEKGEYTVVERNRLLLVLEELRLGSSSLVDEQARLRLGKLVGARYMIFGGYLAVGDLIRVDLRLVEVGSGKIVKGVQKECATPDMRGRMDAVKKAAQEL